MVSEAVSFCFSGPAAVSSLLLSALSGSTSGAPRAKSASSQAVRAGPQHDRTFSPAAAAVAAYAGLASSFWILADNTSGVWLTGLICGLWAQQNNDNKS